MAPALTELVLDEMKLPDSEQLSWLPRLPKLQRLALLGLKTGSAQLPQGIIACSGLTELVMERILLTFSNGGGKFYITRPECRLRALPTAGPYISQLARLSLVANAFSSVPPALAAATALQQLDLSEQLLRDAYTQVPLYNIERTPAPVQGLHVLDNLPRLHRVKLVGFKKGGAGIRRFRAANPNVTVVLDSDEPPCGTGLCLSDWCRWRM